MDAVTVGAGSTVDAIVAETAGAAEVAAGGATVDDGAAVVGAVAGGCVDGVSALCAGPEAAAAELLVTRHATIPPSSSAKASPTVTSATVAGRRCVPVTVTALGAVLTEPVVETVGHAGGEGRGTAITWPD